MNVYSGGTCTPHACMFHHLRKVQVIRQDPQFAKFDRYHVPEGHILLAAVALSVWDGVWQ